MSATTDPLERDGWVRVVGRAALRCPGASRDLPGTRCHYRLMDVHAGAVGYARPALRLWPPAHGAAPAGIKCVSCRTLIDLLFVPLTGGAITFPTSQA